MIVYHCPRCCMFYCTPGRETIACMCMRVPIFMTDEGFPFNGYQLVIESWP